MMEEEEVPSYVRGERQFRPRTKLLGEYKLWTAPEVASLFRVDNKTPTRWARKGWIASIKVGRAILFHEEEVMKVYEKGFNNGDATSGEQQPSTGEGSAPGSD